MTHICISKLTIIGSYNGLSPGRRQAIIWTNAEILLIGLLGTNFSEILIGILTFSFKKMHLKMASAKWRPFCLGLNVLKQEACPHWARLHQPTLMWIYCHRSLLGKHPGIVQLKVYLPGLAGYNTSRIPITFSDWKHWFCCGLCDGMGMVLLGWIAPKICLKLNCLQLSVNNFCLESFQNYIW